jgi:uncharacterized phage-associated protein
MASVTDVAKYIVRVAQDNSEDGEYDITPMKLQKLIYFCQGFYLAFFDAPLFDEDIQAWPHGPVCPTLYQKLQKFSSNPVIFIDAGDDGLSDREKHLIDDVYGHYGQYSASKLRNLTHNEGPWKEASANATISKGNLEKYFKTLIAPKSETALTAAETEELKDILLKAESNGEIDLSKFCVLA